MNYHHQNISVNYLKFNVLFLDDLAELCRICGEMRNNAQETFGLHDMRVSLWKVCCESNIYILLSNTPPAASGTTGCVLMNQMRRRASCAPFAMSDGRSGPK